MKSALALAAAGLIAFSLPVFAQNAKTPDTSKMTGSDSQQAAPSTTTRSSDKMDGDEGRAAAQDMKSAPQDPVTHAPK
jgi:hypothetical protein